MDDRYTVKTTAHIAYLPARLQRLEHSDCGQAVLRSAMQTGNLQPDFTP